MGASTSDPHPPRRRHDVLEIPVVWVALALSLLLHVGALWLAFPSLLDRARDARFGDGSRIAGRSGKLARLEETLEEVLADGDRALVFTQFAAFGGMLVPHLAARFDTEVLFLHGGTPKARRDAMVERFQSGEGPSIFLLSLKAGGTGLTLTAANHVIHMDRWWNPAVEDQARDRAWRIGQTRTVVSHRMVCPGTVDERVEEVVAGKRHIADLVLPKSSSLSDLSADQLKVALGLRPDTLLTEDAT